MPLIERGIPIIPLKPKSKNPATEHAAKDATTDRELIESWNRQNKNFNVGAVATPSTFWMLDDDRGDLAKRIESETEHEYPVTYTVKSRKGFHYYFKQTPASLKMGNLRCADKHGEIFSARVDNMYVVGAGSIHPGGGAYDVINDAPIADAPDWLIEWLEDQAKHSARPTLTSGADGGDGDVAIHEGGRDNFLFRTACRLHDAGLPQPMVESALQGINRDRCSPPMDAATVRRKVESAFSYEGGEPMIHKLK